MKAQLGPVVSHARSQLLSYAQVRQGLGLSRAPSPAERVLVVPSRVRIQTTDDVSRRRVERRIAGSL
jgi:hypothetical protein